MKWAIKSVQDNENTTKIHIYGIYCGYNMKAWLCFLTLTSSRKKGFEICRRVTVFTGISFPIFTPEDVTANIGIGMISLISKRMEYRFVLGLNVLSVWV